MDTLVPCGNLSVGVHSKNCMLFDLLNERAIPRVTFLLLAFGLSVVGGVMEDQHAAEKSFLASKGCRAALDWPFCTVFVDKDRLIRQSDNEPLPQRFFHGVFN